MEFTIFKKWDALLVQYALRIMVMYLWENLKEPIYIHLVPSLGHWQWQNFNQRVFVTPFVRVRQAVQTSVGHIIKLNLKAWLLKPA